MMDVGGFFFEFEAVPTQVPNMLMMTVISFFFSGFVLVKVPFPVTQRFKQMSSRASRRPATNCQVTRCAPGLRREQEQRRLCCALSLEPRSVPALCARPGGLRGGRQGLAVLASIQRNR